MSVALLIPPNLPEIRLPAGQIQSWEQGRLLSINGFVVAIAVSPALFFVVFGRSHASFPPALLEQLIGYLLGRGVSILRLRLRYPLVWHRQFPDTLWFWSKRFVDDCWQRRLVAALPLRLSHVLLPLIASESQADKVWCELGQLADALIIHHPQLWPQFQIELWKICLNWEREWNAALARDQARDRTISPSQFQMCHQVDRSWARLVQSFLVPHGYQINPTTIARLW